MERTARRPVGGEFDRARSSRVARAGHSSHTADLGLYAQDDGDPHSVARVTHRRRLAPEQVEAIRDLHGRGVPIRAIVEELGVNRATVRRYVR